MIGGYWFILANNLDEAAQIAKGIPAWIAASSSKSGRSTRQQIDPALLVLGHCHCVQTGLVSAGSALSSVLTLKVFGI